MKTIITTYGDKVLRDGVYTIYWKDGGASLTSLGHRANGDIWISPCNWINENNVLLKDYKEKIDTIEQVMVHSEIEDKFPKTKDPPTN
jgi:hypothetical protein